jgi:glucokinase-like ROK family protein
MKKANSQQAKVHNRLLILRTIYNNARISRADIARVTGLNRATVSDAVTELMKDGVVAEVGIGSSVAGKPPILLSMVDDARYLIGIDLAESEFRGAVINLRGKIIHRLNLAINGRDGDAALASVYGLLDKLIPLAEGPILGIGIGTPGLINTRQRVVRNAVNLDWHDLPLGDLLDERYKMPVHIANDSQAAALAEFTFGASKNISNLIVINIGRGTGAGIVLNRQLYYGDSFGAGEFGHVAIVENGERCRCGHYGCLETVTSSQAIVRSARAIAKNDLHSKLYRLVASPEEINMDIVSQAFEAGDDAIRTLITEVGRYLGFAAAILVGILNVNRIVIAGRVARFGQALLEPIKQEIKRRSLPGLADETVVEITTLGPDIVILGAAALLLNHELGLP